MTRLSAKTDSDVTPVASRRPRNERRIVSAPTSGGSSAATRPRKTQNESRISSGNAIVSARSEIVLDGPPDLLVADHSAAERDRRVVARSLLDSLRRPVADAVVERLEQRETNVARPSRETIARSPVEYSESTRAVAGSARSRATVRSTFLRVNGRTIAVSTRSGS